MANQKTATFAGGCFWGIEAAFNQLDGVIDAVSGYIGGHVENPTYRQVCGGRTGHAEAVEVTYDPSRVSYEQLLELFWSIHDPTTLNRQGPDVGTQYRSAIFYHDEEQRAVATESKRALENAGTFGRPIVTEIVPAGEFYRAEDYHQRYYERLGIEPHCGIGGGRERW
jgi:peptide-methionine (S)-S-oxide reductase